MNCRNVSYCGRKLSEEHKRKVSEGVKKNLPSTAIKKGQRLSPKTEFKKGQKTWNKGKKGEYKLYPNGRVMPWMIGENNPLWKGDAVGNKSVHNWVRNIKGSPQKCEQCKTTSAKKFEWANKDHKYRRRADDYIRLCTRCHRRYDIKNNGYTTLLQEQKYR